MRVPRPGPMGIAMAIGLVLGAARFAGFAPLDLLDHRAIDLRLLARGPRPPSDQVVIVAVDDESIAEVGRWPWPRSVQARLLERIDAGAPAVIGFDVVQSEPSALPDLAALGGRVDAGALAAVARAMAEKNPEDEALAAAVAKSGRVVLGYFHDFGARPQEGADGGGSAAPVAPTEYPAVQSTAAVPGEGGEAHVPASMVLTTNLASIAAGARASGYFNTLPDPGDGYFRRLPMVVRWRDRMTMPLSLSMLATAFPDRASRLKIASFGVEEVRLGSQRIPVAEDGQLLLNFRGGGRTFRHVPAADVLAGRVEPSTFAGRLVLVGVTATAVADIRATPLDGLFPGVELHATAIDNVLRDDFLTQPRWTVLVEMAAILAGVAALGLAMGRLRGVAAAAVAVVLVGGYLASSQWLFLAAGVPLGIVYPVVAIAVAYMTIGVHHYVTVEREKRRTREAFSRYLNPELARLASEDPEALRLGGVRRELTVLFSDIRGFTSISEGLDPETLVDVLNVYLGEMTDVIFESDGTLDKYIGDAIMAVWGAPVPCDDHAARACSAALGMTKRLAARRDEWTARGWPRIEAGIGLNTGDMVAGNMGSAAHLSYTVIGDNVNLASRLEGLTKTYGVGVLVTEATRVAAGPGFVTRELDLVAVKGKALPVRIHELVATADEADAWRDLLDGFAAALSLYRARRWKEAVAAFEALLERHPGDGPSRLYLERAHDSEADPPPPDWDGVTVMKTK